MQLETSFAEQVKLSEQKKQIVEQKLQSHQKQNQSQNKQNVKKFHHQTKSEQIITLECEIKNDELLSIQKNDYLQKDSQQQYNSKFSISLDHCVNHQNKKGKYRKLKDDNSMIFCSKCAIQMVSQGVNIVEVGAENLKQELNIFHTKIKDFIPKYQNLQQKLERKQQDLNLFYKNEKNKINNIFQQFYDFIQLHHQKHIEQVQKEEENNLLNYQKFLPDVQYNLSQCLKIENDISLNFDKIIQNIEFEAFHQILSQYEKCLFNYQENQAYLSNVYMPIKKMKNLDLLIFEEFKSKLDKWLSFKLQYDNLSTSLQKKGINQEVSIENSKKNLHQEKSEDKEIQEPENESLIEQNYQQKFFKESLNPNRIFEKINIEQNKFSTLQDFCKNQNQQSIVIETDRFNQISQQQQGQQFEYCNNNQQKENQEGSILIQNKDQILSQENKINVKIQQNNQKENINSHFQIKGCLNHRISRCSNNTRYSQASNQQEEFENLDENNSLYTTKIRQNMQRLTNQFNRYQSQDGINTKSSYNSMHFASISNHNNKSSINEKNNEIYRNHSNNYTQNRCKSQQKYQELLDKINQSHKKTNQIYSQVMKNIQQEEENTNQLIDKKQNNIFQDQNTQISQDAHDLLQRQQFSQNKKMYYNNNSMNDELIQNQDQNVQNLQQHDNKYQFQTLQQPKCYYLNQKEIINQQSDHKTNKTLSKQKKEHLIKYSPQKYLNVSKNQGSSEKKQSSSQKQTNNIYHQNNNNNHDLSQRKQNNNLFSFSNSLKKSNKKEIQVQNKDQKQEANQYSDEYQQDQETTLNNKIKQNNKQSLVVDPKNFQKYKNQKKNQSILTSQDLSFMSQQQESQKKYSNSKSNSNKLKKSLLKQYQQQQENMNNNINKNISNFPYVSNFQ
ncbi:hypothetical protein PPERSA_10921 [Pseudocohnilembus persalinus]|uniref:Uncharacterized protein n=1 Tax=Pseudocohnilembus persalinus TaxID=266149 RepID=A0A0V0R9L7_PSEPJ|nr:hypothetical protein PPERSA_10921 [Pseudocohnilembus persalinus]|eukprot:KRX11154.1 hypothetical protein PPERSA_10921 [Pseudocohnilembus persalinus]